MTLKSLTAKLVRLERALRKLTLPLRIAQLYQSSTRPLLPQWSSLTGIKRGINEEQTAKAKARAKDPAKVHPVPESFITYANRCKATMFDSDWQALDAEARKLASTVPIDASPSKRIAGPGKDLLAKADSLLTLPIDQLQAKIDKYKGAVEHDLETDEETGKPDRNSLARLIGKYLNFILAQE